jgi:hypothetical protein
MVELVKALVDIEDVFHRGVSYTARNFAELSFGLACKYFPVTAMLE